MHACIITRIHDGLGRGTNGNRHGQLGLAAFGDPGDLGREAGNVVSLLKKTPSQLEPSHHQTNLAKTIRLKRGSSQTGHINKKRKKTSGYRFQRPLGHKHREVRVLDAEFLDGLVEERLNLLPDGVRPGAQNVAAGNVIVLNHL